MNAIGTIGPVEYACHIEEAHTPSDIMETMKKVAPILGVKPEAIV